jgi:phosphoglycolate phosphatase
MTDRAVLFDLDGTLTDPKPGITRCIQHALAGLGEAVPAEDDLVWCIGPPLQESFPKLLKTADAIRVGQAIELYRARFSTVGLFENALYYPGIPEALRDLRSRGYRTYMATSKPRVFALRIADHFQLSALFEAIHGSELDGTRVDKGELIAHVLHSERVEASRAVMVGDREHDMVGAGKHGLGCLGVTYGYGTAEDLTGHGAHRLAASPAEIVSGVEAFFAELG